SSRVDWLAQPICQIWHKSVSAVLRELFQLCFSRCAGLAASLRPRFGGSGRLYDAQRSCRRGSQISSDKKGPAEAGLSVLGVTLRNDFGVSRSGTIAGAGIGRVMVGPVGLATNPTRSRSRPNTSELGRRQAAFGV